MALPTSGPISMSQIATEFGKAQNLAAHYAVVAGIPAAGAISMSQFYGKTAFVPVGQIIITTQNASTWIVPEGVTSISMVAVQSGSDLANNGTTITVAGVVVCHAKNGARIGDGGGDGGNGGPRAFDAWNWSYGGGGGGAGGYAGNGGNGGFFTGNNGYGGLTSGAGGGGGGGAAGTWPDSSGYKGGGVGLKGQGISGVYNSPEGSPATGGSFGAGPSGSGDGFKGGALSYKNAVSVTPGQVISINIAARSYGDVYSDGAVRFIWGNNRAYPSTNTGDL